MKKNNGFTLVELLAVVVILGIIMVIGGVAATKIKREANIKEAKQIEEMLKDLGPEVYIDNNRSTGEYDTSRLNANGYLKNDTIKNPAGGDDCMAKLIIDDGPTFSAKLCCPGLYKNYEGDDTDDCSDY